MKPESRKCERDLRFVTADDEDLIEKLAGEHELPVVLVRNVVAQEGPVRTRIEGYLLRMKANRKASNPA